MGLGTGQGQQPQQPAGARQPRRWQPGHGNWRQPNQVAQQPATPQQPAQAQSRYPGGALFGGGLGK